ncbi:short-chain dehydrogenase/reductase [Aspergillus stella-maris]|uniref:short-chain dehydrogenase/reductase n=1 Tax=Aspergillus stella-maris TaxID=1810926 RepID=UPI003CCDFC71
MNFGKRSIPFNPEANIPSLEGKAILVTGGNIGLGEQSVLQYAKQSPNIIWLAARSRDKAKAAIDEIKAQLPENAKANIKFLELDLASLDSIKTAAKRVLSESDRLDILLLNAGIMAVPPGLTKDGYELQFGTNYLGHILLAKLLLPLLQKTATLPNADVRLINMTSRAHNLAPKEGIKYDTLRTTAENLGPYGRYGQSKLAQILWTREAASHYPNITINAIHPGLVRTNLMGNATGSAWWAKILGKIANYVFTSVEQGVRNQLWASVSTEIRTGWYYEPVGVSGRETELARDEALARGLWEWTEEELRGHCTV